MITFFSCERPQTRILQGYVEGRFVYVAAPLPGAVTTIPVSRGDFVESGSLLFELESVAEQAALRVAETRVVEARARVQDLQKGMRPAEIETLEATLREARAALVFAEGELRRQEELLGSSAATDRDVEHAKATRDQNQERVTKLEKDIEVARLPARIDAIAAANANLEALEAERARAAWNLDQKRQRAPCGGVVFDTLYREGEFVPAGHPIVVLLPPTNIEVRAFVPESRLAAVHLGDRVAVRADGAPTASFGRITFISPKPEYTPPVIYSLGSREKFVTMIVIEFAAEVAAQMHPGQPVDVTLGE
jgi:HlyD family secretion protein